MMPQRPCKSRHPLPIPDRCSTCALLRKPKYAQRWNETVDGTKPECPQVSPIADRPGIWAYGVTTIKKRKDTLLPRTLASLAAGGFDKPRIFVDGCTFEEAAQWERETLFHVEVRRHPLLTFGNWAMALAELYIRQPTAERYAIFQDDFVCVRNLRQYLERSPFPPRGYLNLYTFPQNHELAGNRQGWFQSNQRGLGAVALVFTREGVQALLASDHFVSRPTDPKRGWRAVDGGIVDSMRKAGWHEYCHNPSLVQHTGLRSSMGNGKHALAVSFPGESFDALQLLGEVEPDTMARFKLGDAVSNALAFVGITEERVSKVIGKPCGCKARKEKLNRLWDWATGVRDQQKDPEQAKQELEQFLEQHEAK